MWSDLQHFYVWQLFFSFFQQDDPFFSSDPFGSASFSSTTPAKQATEAFDPFGTGSASNNKSQVS